MQKTLNDKRGFTLVETMIAMVIFSVAMLGAGALYVKASQVNTNGNIISSANFLAKSTLETYKNMSLTDLTATGAVPIVNTGLTEEGATGGIYTRTVSIEEIDGGDGRRVTVTITWPDRRLYASDAITLTANLRGGGL